MDSRESYLIWLSILGGVLVLIALVVAVFSDGTSQDCQDKGGQLITDKYNRTYCVEVIE